MSGAAWFKHDVGCSSDLKLMALMGKFGLEGYALYFILVEQIAAQDSRALPMYALDAVGARFGKSSEYMAEFLQCCIKVQLFEADAESFWSEGLKKRLDAYDAKADAERKRKRSGTDAETERKVLETERNRCGRDAEEARNPSGMDAEPSQSNSLSNSDSFSSLGIQGGSGGEPEPPDGVLKLGEFCEISEIEYENYLCLKGKPFIDRAVELTNAWVGESKHDPTEFQKRRGRAKQLGYLWAKWVFVQVEKEFADRAKHPPPKKQKQSGQESFEAKITEIAGL